MSESVWMLGSAVEQGLKRLDAWIEIRFQRRHDRERPGDGPTPGLQFALQVPPRIFGAATTTRGVTSSWSWAASWSRSCRRGAQRVRRWNAHRWFPQPRGSVRRVLSDPTHESALSRSLHGGQLRVG